MTLVDYLAHGRQELADMLQWHKARKPELTDAELTGYAAGFLQAWQKARADIVAHGVPKIADWQDK